MIQRGILGDWKLRLKFLALLALLSPAGAAQAWNNGLARTPPMGWNSWNHYCFNVKDADIRRAADAMVSSGMAELGYQYINIDDGWAAGRDSQGKILPGPNFPDMTALAAYVHSKGLKFGLYTCAGSQTCTNRPGSAGYEIQDAQTYASWGVDYLKEDWCQTEGEYSSAAYKTMANALVATGRPICFSLCNWGIDQPWIWGPTLSNLWRTTSDLQDHWPSVITNFQATVGLHKYAGPGRWNDPDMLEVGNGGMTDAQDQAHFSMWCMLAAPLIAGNDLGAMSAATLATLTNPEAIAVDQDPQGRQGYLVETEGRSKLLVYARPLVTPNTWAVLLLNLGPEAAGIKVDWSALGMQGTASVRDLWLHKDMGQFPDHYAVQVPSNNAVLLKTVFCNSCAVSKDERFGSK
jgi:alpha-galactosidase